MNNKGAIFSGYMYVLLVFFLLSLSTLLVVLNDSNKISNKAREGAEKVVDTESSEFIITLSGDKSVCMNVGDDYVEPGFSAKDINGNVVTVTVTSNLNKNLAGEYIVTYTAKDKGKEKSVERKIYVMNNDFAYVNSPQEFSPKCDGYYTVELWGARHNNGLGGYTKGTTKLSEKDKLYIYTGEFSSTGNATAFNGGTGSSGGYPGGGATDIRLLNKAWNNLESLKSRIMVAGGAGADSGTASFTHGGGLVGLKGGTVATPGTQTAPGVNESGSYLPPSFGIGGGGCGGGGGYYGAGGATCVSGGAGGSGFISGAAGVNAITNDLAITHTNNTLHYSGKYFVNNSILIGNNDGFGKAKITYVGPEYPKTNTNFNNVRYVRDCSKGSSSNVHSHWIELQVIKNGLNIALGKLVVGTTGATIASATTVVPFLGNSPTVITDGVADILSGTSHSYIGGTTYPLLKCATVDLGKAYDIDEVAVWHYYDGRTYNDMSTSVSTDGSVWTTVMSSTGPDTVNGFRVSAWEDPLIYAEALIVAGGGGGGANHGGGGGAGGALQKTVPLISGTTYTITVGGGGAPAASSTLPASDGGNSVAFGFTATGGGGGGNRNDATQTSPGRNGGSGGGGGGSQPTLPLNWNPGTGIFGQGNNGGTAVDLFGGGGGGASSVGATATTVAGSGGTGILSSISGVSKFYAGGGGGGAYSHVGLVGVGGSGVGGSGSFATVYNGTLPAANTGSGGGGGGPTAGLGCAGSAGIVIVKYFGPQIATGGTVTSSGGYTIHTFTTVGAQNLIVN